MVDSRAMTRSRSAIAWALGVLGVRLVSLSFAPPNVSAALALTLDAASVLILALAVLFGQVIGMGFGSITLTFVALGLPIAGLGALTETLAGRDASNLSGMLSLLALGVGFGLSAPSRESRFDRGMVGALSLGAFALGTKLMFERYGLADGAWLAAPYGVAGFAALVVRPLSASRSRAPSAEREASR